MIQGRGYVIPVVTLATGTSNNTNLLEFRTTADVAAVLTTIQGHYSNGITSVNASYAVYRASAATPGTAITPLPTNPNSPAATFTASRNPTGVGLSPTTPLATFGGNGGSNFGWYPSVEENQVFIPPSSVMIVRMIVAPTSSLNMEATIGVTEL